MALTDLVNGLWSSAKKTIAGGLLLAQLSSPVYAEPRPKDLPLFHTQSYASELSTVNLYNSEITRGDNVLQIEVVATQEKKGLANEIKDTWIAVGGKGVDVSPPQLWLKRINGRDYEFIPGPREFSDPTLIDGLIRDYIAGNNFTKLVYPFVSIGSERIAKVLEYAVSQQQSESQKHDTQLLKEVLGKFPDEYFRLFYIPAGMFGELGKGYSGLLLQTTVKAADYTSDIHWWLISDPQRWRGLQNGTK